MFTLFACLTSGRTSTGEESQLVCQRDLQREATLEPPGETLLPLRIETAATGLGGGNPRTLLEITGDKVVLTMPQDRAVVRFEGLLAGTPLAQPLAALRPSDLVGAYVIGKSGVVDGGRITLSNGSGHLWLGNVAASELPPPFDRFAPLLAAFLEIRDTRKGLARVSETPRVSHRIDELPEIAATLAPPSATIYPLTIERIADDPDAPPQPRFEITETDVKLFLLNLGELKRYEGKLAETGLAGALARLTPAELAGAHAISNPNIDEKGTRIVLRNASGYLSVQEVPGTTSDAVREKFPGCCGVLDVLQAVLVHLAGLRPVASDPWEGSRYVLDELPEIEAKLAPPPASLHPLVIEKRPTRGKLARPADVLDITETGIRLRTPELDTIATYEGRLADIGLERLYDFVKAADLTGAVHARNPSGDDGTETVVRNAHYYFKLSRRARQELPPEYASMRWPIRALNSALEQRAKLKLTSREPIPGR